MSNERRNWLVVATVAACFVCLGMRGLATTTQGQENQVAPSKLIWSIIDTAGAPARVNVYRAKVPGGWLVLVNHEDQKERRSSQGYSYGMGIGTGVTFVPDPEHTWRTP